MADRDLLTAREVAARLRLGVSTIHDHRRGVSCRASSSAGSSGSTPSTMLSDLQLSFGFEMV
jgi:hypothetical protein